MDSSNDTAAGAPQRPDSLPDLSGLAKEMNVPTEALEAAVKAVGTDRNRIKDFLSGGNAATQEAG